MLTVRKDGNCGTGLEASDFRAEVVADAETVLNLLGPASAFAVFGKAPCFAALTVVTVATDLAVFVVFILVVDGAGLALRVFASGAGRVGFIDKGRGGPEIDRGMGAVV